MASGNGVFLQDVVVAAGALAGGKFGLNLKDVTGVDNKKRHLLPGGKFRPERLKALCDATRDKGDGVVGHFLCRRKFRGVKGFCDRGKRHGKRCLHEFFDLCGFFVGCGNFFSHG